MGRRRKGERIDGVLLLDKPGGLSSNDALIRARRLLGAAKAGHGGTLDPMATGLLPVLLGEATKFSADLLEADKSYEATLKLGVSTDSADAEGAVIASRPVPPLDRERVESVLARFRGPLDQVPPMYSALKRDGRPLYEYARAGIELERQARPVMIHQLVMQSLQPDGMTITVDCSKGTYIRVLASDIGEALGCGAHLTALRRTRVGRLALTSALSLEALEQATPDQRLAALAPVDALLQTLPRVVLDARRHALFAHGQSIEVDPALDGRVRVYAPSGELTGVAEAVRGRLKPVRLLATIDPAIESAASGV